MIFGDLNKQFLYALFVEKIVNLAGVMEIRDVKWQYRGLKVSCLHYIIKIVILKTKKRDKKYIVIIFKVYFQGTGSEIQYLFNIPSKRRKYT